MNDKELYSWMQQIYGDIKNTTSSKVIGEFIGTKTMEIIYLQFQ